MNTKKIAAITRDGWDRDEDELLFSEVKRERENGKPLKSVFEKVAKLTGRKPNSIRNYYYMRIKEMGKTDEYYTQATTFVPFTQDEVTQMLRFILQKQASGMSVRACTLELGNNDTAQMLRYQNKYRAVIKNNRPLVLDTIAQLEREGKKAHNPYTNCSKSRTGRPKMHDSEKLLELVAETVSDLDEVEGLDVVALFESLGALALSASKGIAATKKLSALENADDYCIIALREENNELHEKIRADEEELLAQKQRYGKLFTMFRQLMSVNREFLGMTSVVKMSSLGSYVRELAHNIEDFERSLYDYAK